MSHYSPNNYADPRSCRDCAAIEHRSHRHSENDFRIASTSRVGLYHRVVVDFRGFLHCSCEWGQHRERKLRRNRNLDIAECIHVDMTRRMISEDWWIYPSVSDLARRSSRTTRPLLESDDDFELFDGDEISAPSSLPLTAA